MAAAAAAAPSPAFPAPLGVAAAAPSAPLSAAGGLAAEAALALFQGHEVGGGDALSPPHLHHHHHRRGDRDPLPPAVAALYAGVCVLLVVAAGLASGLTLALLPLDGLDLALLAESGTTAERRAAARVAPLVARRHRLLVTLLLCNAAANEALPIFLDRLLDPLTAVIVSVTVVLVAGEIVPQAVCARHGLAAGASAAWLVRGLMALCSPLAWPLGRLLDALLGGEQRALFRGRAQLKALVDVHGADQAFGGTLSADEVRIIRGALDLTSKTARLAMTPLAAAFTVSDESPLDDALLDRILASGNSRVPVHRGADRARLVGLVLVKELVLVDPGAGTPVGRLPGGLVRPLPRLPADTPLYDMLRLFEAGGSHMAALVEAGPAAVVEGEAAEGAGGGGGGGAGVVAAAPAAAHASAAASSASEPRALGIITIEDVIEELLGHEIVDETDVFLDNARTMRVDVGAMTKALPPQLRRLLATGGLTPRVGLLASLAGRQVARPAQAGGAGQPARAGSAGLGSSPPGIGGRGVGPAMAGRAGGGGGAV